MSRKRRRAPAGAKRQFSRTAAHVHPRNLPRPVAMRGGIRL